MSAAVDAITSELTCPSCGDYFCVPLLLPCQHSQCEKCLQDPPNDSRHSFMNGMSQTSAFCPPCKKSVNLGMKGVEGLQRNIFIENVLQRLGFFPRDGSEGRSDPVLCQMCEDDPPDSATKACVECSVRYCDECFQACHRMKGPLASHTITEPTLSPTGMCSADLICPDHEKEKMNMFCLSDDTLVCALCKLLGRHKEHDVAELTATYKQKKDYLLSSTRTLSEVSENMGVFMNRAEDTYQEIKANGSKAKTSLFSEFDRLIRYIEVKKQEMGQQIDHHISEKLHSLTGQMGVCQEQVSNIDGLVSLSQEALRETDPVPFLQAVKCLKDRIAMASTVFPLTKLSVSDTKCELLADFSYEAEVIQYMDFLKAPKVPRIEPSVCVPRRNMLTLRWAPPNRSAVDFYTVEYRRVNGDGLWSVIDNVTECSFVLDELEYDSGYQLRLKATNRAGESEYTEVFMMHTMPETPGPPLFHRVQCFVEVNTVKLVWQQGEGKAAIDNYSIEYCTENSSWQEIKELMESEYELTDLEYDTHYAIRVRAINRAGAGDYSEIMEFTTWPPVPEAPALQPEHCSGINNRYNVQWKSKGEEKIDAYVVEYTQDSSSLPPETVVDGDDDSDWKSTGELTSCHYVLKDLNYNTIYRVRVRSCNISGYSEPSDEVNFETGDPPIKFTMDSRTSHVNLKLTNNNMMVQYDRGGAKARSAVSTSNSDPFIGVAFNVLGDMGVARGRHYWEVRVKPNGCDRIGIAYRSAPRDQLIGETPHSWCVARLQGEERWTAITNKKQKKLTEILPTKIGVLVDYEGGYVAFFNVETKLHLHTFKVNFEEPVYPALTVWPAQVNVTSGILVPDYLSF